MPHSSFHETLRRTTLPAVKSSRNERRWVSAWVSMGLLIAVVLAANGCGDDPRPTVNDGGLRDGEVPMSKPPPTMASCLAAHTQDGGPGEENRCLCESCLDTFSACDEDRGCTDIRSCMQRTGCHDMNSCYFERAPCRAAIERWGIMSFALSLAQSVQECSVEKGCTTVQTPECRVVGELLCDGREDCSGDEVCCGHFNGDTYDHASCQASCDAASERAVGEGGTWTQLCHPGDECPGKGDSCLAYDLLPSFLYRCEDTGQPPASVGSRAAAEVNCGSKVCGDGQKCCLRAPKQPYCAPANEDCACRLPTDAHDASVPGEDAGGDDAGR
jgi:hypothetical protein